MAKIPIILEPGRADSKLAESKAIYDSILKQFQSDINREYKFTKEQVEFLTPIIERLNDVQDTLTSIDADKPLSAQQGKILKELLDAKVIEVGGIPMDSEPTEGNTEHVVTSDGINKALTKKVNNVTFESNINSIESNINSIEFVKDASKLITGETKIKDLFTIERGYITTSGYIEQANSDNYVSTDYIDISILFGHTVYGMHSNSSGINVWFGDKDKNRTGYISVVNGTHEYKFDEELLSLYPNTKYVVLADISGAVDVSIDCTFEDIYNRITDVNSKAQEIQNNVESFATDIEDINYNILKLNNQVFKEIKQQIWNESNRGAWIDNDLTCNALLQKVPSEFEGHIANGLKFYNRGTSQPDIIKVSLVTIDTNIPEATTKATDYAISYFEVDETAGTKEELFDNPVIIKPNSYIRVYRDIAKGSVGGNGTPNSVRYVSAGTSVYRMPYSAVKFKEYSNAAVGAMLIIDSDSIPTQIKDLQSQLIERPTFNDFKINAIFRDAYKINGGINRFGVFQDNKLYACTDFIDIKDATTLTCPALFDQSGICSVVFFAEDKSTVVGYIFGVSSHVITDYDLSQVKDACYARFSCITSFINRAIILKKKEEKILDEVALKLPQINSVFVWMLPNIYCLVGKTMQIFKKSILYCENVDNYYISIKVNSGSNRFTVYQNYFTYSPVSGDGDSNITINVENNSGYTVASCDVIFHAVAIPTLSEDKNVMFVGDSWTQAIYPSEVARMLTGEPTSHVDSVSDCQFPTPLSLPHINFVGTNNNGKYTDMPWREGASGQTINYHLGNSSPFYNTEKGEVDFTDYVNSGKVNGTIRNLASGDKIDVCVLIHGRNATVNIGLLDTFITKLKEHNPNIVVLFGTNVIGADNNNKKQTGNPQTAILEMLYSSIIDRYENVFMIPVMSGLDTRYNMVFQESPVNYRNTKYNEIIDNPNNIFHPNNNGYCEIADEVIGALSMALNV